VEIRCATGGWQEGDEVEDDRWIRIAEDGENEIVWRTS
jgi:SLT domain-containing protein